MMEQSEHMQIYLQIAAPNEIQEMINALIYDLISASFGISASDQRILNEMYGMI